MENRCLMFSDEECFFMMILAIEDVSDIKSFDDAYRYILFISYIIYHIFYIIYQYIYIIYHDILSI